MDKVEWIHLCEPFQYTKHQVATPKVKISFCSHTFSQTFLSTSEEQDTLKLTNFQSKWSGPTSVGPYILGQDGKDLLLWALTYSFKVKQMHICRFLHILPQFTKLNLNIALLVDLLSLSNNIEYSLHLVILLIEIICNNFYELLFPVGFQYTKI